MKLRDVDNKEDLVVTLNEIYRFIEAYSGPLQSVTPVNFTLTSDVSYPLERIAKYKIITLVVSVEATFTINDVNCFIDTVIEIRANLSDDLTVILDSYNETFLLADGEFVSLTLLKTSSGWQLLGRFQQ